MSEKYIEKKIRDRNGNMKTIRVRVQGDDSAVEPWRGLEYGWTEDDVSPENIYTRYRQCIQQIMIDKGGDVVARHISIERKYVPMITLFLDTLVITTFGYELPNIDKWEGLNNFSYRRVVHHVYDYSQQEGKRHRTILMS